MTLAKAIAARERHGKRGGVVKHGGIKAATLLHAKGTAVYDDVNREVMFLNRRIRNYQARNQEEVAFSGETVQPTGNRPIDWKHRDVMRYERRRDKRNEFLRSVHQKRRQLKKVIEGTERWDDKLFTPIPVARPRPFNWNERDPVGPHPPSVFRSVPIESQAEKDWLGSAGSRGSVWRPAY